LHFLPVYKVSAHISDYLQFNPLAYYIYNTRHTYKYKFLGKNGNFVHLYFIHAKLIFKRAFHQLSNGIRHVMPSTDRRLELKAKDIDGSDHLTAGCVCQWAKLTLRCETVAPETQMKFDIHCGSRGKGGTSS